MATQPQPAQLSQSAKLRLHRSAVIAEAMMDEAVALVQRRMPNVHADHRMTMVAAVLNAISSNYHSIATAPKS